MVQLHRAYIVAAGLTIPLIASRAAAQWSAAFAASGPNDNVSALAVASPSPGEPARLYIGGSFTAITTPQGSIPASYIASWSGQSWVPGPGVNALVYSLALHPYSGVPTLFAGKSTGSPATGPLSR